MNPVALITGASRGIGRGIALELARLGWDLVINYVRDQSAGEETVRQANVEAASFGQTIRAVAVQADISHAQDRRRLLDRTRTEFGRVDLLVNNAGVAPQARADLLEAGEESFDRLLNINLKGPFFLTQAVARWMIEELQASASANRRAPRIVIISSVSAYTASVNRGDYCVSKAALSMVTQLFAIRLASSGINVYEIRPGIIATDMTSPVQAHYDRLIRDGLNPIARWGTPADVAKAVGAIAQDLLPFSTGQVIDVDGGFHLRRL
ncbi:MAG TPA: 3-ketoacyl-ACP reductase [Verrucomicrobiae bacterium]|jgi:3-oxoacyl-[acyl-carrier protein] reductase|nr:3-ketoacyl-ACP reductase [Verrucomicrobiae bacterium]